MARAYNAWMADWCARGQGRFYGVGLVPIEDVATSIEIMREAKQLGLRAIMVPAVLKDRNLDHPDLEPFYAAAAELDMPLGIHGAPGIHLPNLGSHRFDNYLQVHCVSFPFDMMVASTALVLGGVLERHPKLRVALLESGVGWVPYFMERMEEHLEKRGRLTPECKREPKEYIARGQLYVSCEPEEVSVPLAVADARRPLHHVRQRLPALGHRLPELDEAAARAHRTSPTRCARRSWAGTPSASTRLAA